VAKLLLSFDFEDWHQLVHRRLGLADWDRRGPALERQTNAIVKLLDELGVRATFFLLGMTAERYPDLVRELGARGHDIASHGYEHTRVFEQTPDEFRRDLSGASS
jgi:peptidoglycan/xylan/chitin deacetylase (PgdA/CDA1 family)